MKLHIGVNLIPLNGYTNIDPIPGEGKVVGDFHSLDAFCQDSECLEILAPDLLDYVHGSDILNVVDNYVKKLRHGGRIIIGGTDFVEVAKKVATGEMHVHEANVAIFGKSKLAWESKQGCYSVADLVGLLTEKGLLLEVKRVNGTSFIVSAYRE